MQTRPQGRLVPLEGKSMTLKSPMGLAVAVLMALGLVACGKETPPEDPGGTGGGGGATEDAGRDAGANGGPDGGLDAGSDQDAGVDQDAGFDAGSDQDAGQRYHPVGWSVPDGGAFHGPASQQGLGACTTCHGPDLTGGTAGVSCDQCHSGWKTNCTFCHGGVDNPTGAPPSDVLGRSATTEVTVGAHTSHVGATHAIASPIDCVACHPTATDALSPGHIDPAPAELNLTGWVRGTPSCGVYCHGAFPGGTATNLPLWTQVDGAQVACGTCHASQPTTGSHPSAEPAHAFMGANCSICHLAANATGTAIARPELHVNGAKDVVPAGGTWNATTLTCSPSCHGPQAW